MPEYEYETPVNAPADRVFRFVSQVRNLPRYVPTAQFAEASKGNHVRLRGEVRGHFFEDTGLLKVDEAARRMEWGSDGESEYSGWLTVEERAGQTSLTVHLSFTPWPEQDRKYEQSGGRDADIQRGLEFACMSVKNICEGRGDKMEPLDASEQEKSSYTNW